MLVDIPPFMMTDITDITMFDCKDGYVGIHIPIVRQKIGYFTGQARQSIMDLIPSAENGLVFVS